MRLSNLLHKISAENILGFLRLVKKYLLYICYKCKQGFLWFIKRLAISIGIAWSAATFFEIFALIYVGLGLTLFPTYTEGANELLDSIPVLMFKLFFGFLVAVFIFVSIPQGYNVLKGLFSPKELKSLKDSVDKPSEEIDELKKRVSNLEKFNDRMGRKGNRKNKS